MRHRPGRVGWGRSAALRPARHVGSGGRARATPTPSITPTNTRARRRLSTRTVRVSGTHRPARRTTHDTSRLVRAHPTILLCRLVLTEPARARTVKCPVTQHTHTSASPPTYAIPLLWARSRTLTELHSSTRALRRFLWRRVRSRRARNLPPNSDPCGMYKHRKCIRNRYSSLPRRAVRTAGRRYARSGALLACPRRAASLSLFSLVCRAPSTFPLRLALLSRSRRRRCRRPSFTGARGGRRT